MQITKHRYVRLDYQLSSGDGEQISSSQTGDPLIYIHGTEHLLEGLEEALEGHSEGDELEVELTPEQAYGVRRPELVHAVSRDQFPPEEDLQPGMAISATGPHGELKMVVVKAKSEQITLDANHMLAGMTLIFALNALLLLREVPRLALWVLTRALPPRWLAQRRAAWGTAFERAWLRT